MAAGGELRLDAPQMRGEVGLHVVVAHRVGGLPAPFQHLALRRQDLRHAAAEEDDLVVVVRGQVGQERGDHLDPLAAHVRQPRRVARLVEVLHPLELEVAVRIVVVGGADAVDRELEAARREHPHQHRRARAGEPRDDDDRRTARPPAQQATDGAQHSHPGRQS